MSTAGRVIVIVEQAYSIHFLLKILCYILVRCIFHKRKAQPETLDINYCFWVMFLRFPRTLKKIIKTWSTLCINL